MKSTKEERITKAKEYQKLNYEAHKKHMRTYVRKHKKKIVDYNKVYKKKKYYDDVEFKQKIILKTNHSQFVRGLKYPFSDIVGMSLNKYKAYIFDILKEGYDWSNYGKEWRIGRIDNELDVNDIDSIYKYFNYKNVKIIYKIK